MRLPKYHPTSIKDQLVARYTVEFFAPFEFLERLQNCFSLGMSVTIKEHRGAAHILVISCYRLWLSMCLGDACLLR